MDHNEKTKVNKKIVPWSLIRIKVHTTRDESLTKNSFRDNIGENDKSTTLITIQSIQSIMNQIEYKIHSNVYYCNICIYRLLFPYRTSD